MELSLVAYGWLHVVVGVIWSAVHFDDYKFREIASIFLLWPVVVTVVLIGSIFSVAKKVMT